MSIVRQTTRSLRAGFATKTLERAGTILAGNMGATFFTEKLASIAPMIRSNTFFEIASLLGVASVQAFVVKKFIPKMLNASDILIGGILAGVTRGVKAVLPGSFTTCGLGEDFEGMGDSYYPTPWQVNHAILTSNGYPAGMGYAPGPDTKMLQMSGMGAFANPNQPFIGTHGLSDHATANPSGQVLVHGAQPRLIQQLDGLANDEVGREIAMQM